MPAKRRGPTSQEEIIELTGLLSRRGYNQTEIAKKLGVSQPLVSENLKKVRLQYRERAQANHSELVEEKCAQYAEIRRECWEAWERSKKPTRKVTVEKALRTVKKAADEGETAQAGGNRIAQLEAEFRKVKEVITSEGRLPASEYMAVIVKTLEAERLIRGLDPPKELKVAAVSVPWEELVRQADKPIGTVEDAIEAAAVGLPALPPPVNGTNGHAQG